MIISFYKIICELELALFLQVISVLVSDLNLVFLRVVMSERLTNQVELLYVSYGICKRSVTPTT